MLKWRAEMKIDGGAIDEDHRKLIGIANSVLDSASAGDDLMTVAGVLRELVEYTRYHFRREEQIFENTTYPYVQEHKDVHRKIEQKLLELTSELLSGDVKNVHHHINIVLRDWIIDHVIKQDRGLTHHLPEQEHTQPEYSV